MERPRSSWMVMEGTTEGLRGDAPGTRTSATLS